MVPYVPPVPVAAVVLHGALPTLVFVLETIYEIFGFALAEIAWTFYMLHGNMQDNFL